MHIPKGLRYVFALSGLLGYALLALDVKLAYQFGASIGEIEGYIYALIAVGSGILLVLAAFFYLAGCQRFAAGLACAWVLAFGFNVWSQVGVATAGRMGDVQKASLQQAAHKDVEKDKADLEAKQKFFIERRATLESNMKSLTQTKLGGWSVTTAPAAPSDLDPMIEAKKLEVANESKRGGCQRECEKRTNELSHLQRLRSMAVEIQDNEKQLTATETGLTNVRSKLANTDAGNSAGTNQSKVHAKLMSGSLHSNPNAEQVTVANEATGIYSAFALVVLATMMILAHAYPHLMEVRPMGWVEPEQRSQPPARPSLNKYAVANRPGANITNYIVEQPQQQPVIIDPAGKHAMDAFAKLKADLRSISQPRTA